MAASAGEEKAYIVLVTGKLKAGQMETFLNLFRPLAQYVHEHEHEAHSYKISVGAEDPDKLVIFERYTNKEFVETVHWQSAAFKTFQTGVREANIEWLEKAVVKYTETDIGYMHRAA